MNRRSVGVQVLCAFAVVLLATLSVGCGEASTDSPAETVTVIERTVEAPAEQAGSGQRPATDRGGSADEPAPEPENPGGGAVEVPDVVGGDHQLAQDTMQAAGLYNLREEDATGQGRLLIIDRNWTVVRQDPPVGTRVGEDEEITLYSKKDGE